MKIHQIYTNSRLRNFTYFMVFNNATAIVIDPWSDELVNSFLKKHKLTLTTIINTHEHWDHTQGNQALVEQYGCEVWAHENGQGKIPGLSRILKTDEVIVLDEKNKIKVMNTPGHSQAHLCFMVYIEDKASYIFTGDILFNAGVGNCHGGGDLSDMYKTISEQFNNLPDEIVILPGHDYLENNLHFTLNREPSNKIAQQWLVKYKQSDVFSDPITTTMHDERQINTFFRLNNKEIIERLPSPVSNDKEVFFALRSLRDQW